MLYTQTVQHASVPSAFLPLAIISSAPVNALFSIVYLLPRRFVSGLTTAGHICLYINHAESLVLPHRLRQCTRQLNAYINSSTLN